MKVVRKMIVAVLCCAVIMGMTLSAEAATGRGISERLDQTHAVT